MSELHFSDVIKVYRSTIASQTPEAVLGMLLAMPAIDRERIDDAAALLHKGPGDLIAKYAGEFQNYMLGAMKDLPPIPTVPEKDKVATLGEFNSYYADRIRLSEEGLRNYFDTILVDEKDGVGALAFEVKLPTLSNTDPVVTFHDMASLPWQQVFQRTYRSTKDWKQDIDRALGFNSSGVYYTLNSASYVSMAKHPGTSIPTEEVLKLLEKESLREMNLKGLYIAEVMSRVNGFTQPQFENLFRSFFRK